LTILGEEETDVASTLVITSSPTGSTFAFLLNRAQPPPEEGTREPFRVKQLDPLLQPTKIGEASSTISENVSNFFIFAIVRSNEIELQEKRTCFKENTFVCKRARTVEVNFFNADEKTRSHTRD